MDYKFFLKGITSIILNPEKAWITIHSDNNPIKVIQNYLLIPLILLVSVSTFIGSMIFSNVELSWIYSLFVGIKSFIALFLTIYISSFIFGEITYPLDLGKNFKISFYIIVYSTVPFLICQILSGLFESLLFVNILGLYGLYIFWTGTEKMLAPAHYKKMPLLIASTICIVAIYALSDLSLTKLIDRVYFHYFS
jgi:hypothetical protein